MAETEDFHQKAPKNDILNVLFLFENVQSIFVLFFSPLYEASFSAMSLVGCPCVVCSVT